MTEIAARSIDAPGSTSRLLEESGSEYVQGWRVVAILVALFLVSAVSQIDRILPFVMAEAIKSDLSLSDTQIGLLTGVAFADRTDRAAPRLATRLRIATAVRLLTSALRRALAVRGGAIRRLATRW